MAGKPAVETQPEKPQKPRKATPGAPGKAEHPVYSRDELQRILAERESWTARELAETLARAPRRKKSFETDSGIPIPDVLDPAHRS
jgi:methylmalonyl-CoA mutase N-terminal domain/subunit